MFLNFCLKFVGFLDFFNFFLNNFVGFLPGDEEVSWTDYCSIREGVAATCGRLVQQWVITKVDTGGLDEEKEDYDDCQSNVEKR